MAIRFRGMLRDFSQLEYGHCPPEARQLEEGNDLEQVLAASLRQSLPLFVLLGALAGVRLAHGLNWGQGTSPGQVLLATALWVLAYGVLIVVHEWIHALFFPRRAVKDIWVYQLQAAMVYCNTPLTRSRFLAMSLAPAVLLGFLPFIGWLFWAGVPGAVASIWWLVMSLTMIFGGIGDFYNVRNVLAQVPKDAYVFNYGLHTYWITDPRKP